MNYMVITYSLYLIISVSITIWVARTLHRNGRIFLVDSFLGNEKLADSVNHLLVVGFYLINIGYVTLALKTAIVLDELRGVFEVVSTKVGLNEADLSDVAGAVSRSLDASLGRLGLDHGNSGRRHAVQRAQRVVHQRRLQRQ